MCFISVAVLSQQIAQLELLCQQFYESMDINVRSEAEKALVNFSDSPESLPQCQIILERSQVHMNLQLVSLMAGVSCGLTPASVHLRVHMLSCWPPQHSLNLSLEVPPASLCRTDSSLVSCREKREGGGVWHGAELFLAFL